MIETKRNTNTQQQTVCFALVQCPDLVLKKNGNLRVTLKAKPQAFWQQIPIWAGKKLHHLESSPGTPQFRPA